MPQSRGQMRYCRSSSMVVDTGVVRWGVLGAADIAVRQLIPAMHQARGNRVQALGSRSLDRAHALASQLDIPHACGSYAEVLADPEVDAIYIPLPNSMHADWTIRAAEAGKHVLCEKPMATSVAECEAMVSACRAASVRFMEAFMYRFHPQHARVQALIAAGLIGRPRLVRSSFCVQMGRPPQDIRFAADLGGGSLFDVGVYAIDAARWLAAAAQSELGPGGLAPSANPRQVAGHATRDARGVDLSAAGALSFADGLLGVITCSFEANGGGSYEIIGPLGKITAQHAFTPRPDSNPRITWDTSAGSGEESFPGPINQYALMLEAFASAVLTNTDPPLADDAGTGNIAVIQSILATPSRPPTLRP